MKVTGVFVVMAIWSHFEGVASQDKYKEGMCLEFQPLIRSGNFYCNRNIDPVVGPNGKTHMNKCLMCRELLTIRDMTYNGGSSWSTDSSGKGDDCAEFIPYFMKGLFACTRESDPVRDASGKPYSNKCIMCARKFKAEVKTKYFERTQPQNGNNQVDDECHEYRSQMRLGGELGCTRENDPVRDASGRTHINKCVMCSEKFKQEMIGSGTENGRGQSQNAYESRIAQGNSNAGGYIDEKNCNPFGGQVGGQRNDVNNPCANEERIPPGDYRSYTNCGGNGNPSEYRANCERDYFNKKQKRKGAGTFKLNCSAILDNLKKEGTACSTLWSPVCGTDGNTYSNKCFLCSAIMDSKDGLTLKQEGECPEVVHGKVNCSKYPQTRGKVLCERSTQEVCGTDGETHSSECMLCDRILKTKSEIGIKNIGPCPKGK